MTKSVFLSFIMTLSVVFCQKLVLDCKDGNQFSDWTVLRPDSTSFISTYLSQTIFGGNNRFKRVTQIQRMVPYLPEHDTIIIKFKLLVWDSTGSVNRIQIQVDEQIYQAMIYTASYPEIEQFTFSFSHSSISALINIQPQSLYEWGLHYLQLYIDKVNLDNQFLRKIGIDYTLIGNELTSTEGWKDSNDLSIIQTCADITTVSPSTLTYIVGNTLQLPECDYFSIYFKLFLLSQPNTVVLTVETYETNSILSSSTVFSCSDTQTNYFKLFQVSFEKIKIPYMRTVTITISVPSYSFGLRDFEIHYFKYETMPPLVVGCSSFYNEQCLNCIEGWNYISTLHICQPICGDGKVQYIEQCDDGNNVPFDGCYNCKFQCQQNCKECVFGKCKIFYQNEIQISAFSCDENPLIYNFQTEQQKNFCTSLCGNGKVDPLEECDDQNNYLYDGCHKCKFSCPLNCKVCSQGKCNLCNQGYQLKNNKCSPVCGDNIKQDEEQCDDGNIILFDGCYKCQNNCRVGCQECINQYCLKCMDGWNFNNGECEQVCGDYKVAILSQEQCDSPNFQICVNCQQQCGPYCMYCTSYSNCYQCFNDILLSNGECIPYCGDGIVTDTEQCDDFNDESNDGCFNCRLECKLGCLECQTYDTCYLCDSEFFYLDQSSRQCILFPQTETPETDDYSIIDNGNTATDNGDISTDNGNTSSNNGNTSPNNGNTSSFNNGQNNSTSNNSTQNNLSNPYSSYGLNISESTIKLSELICKDHHIFLDGNCVSLCGNGILETDYEECDDGNQNGGDGCSFECFVEDSFKCINSNNSMSQCTFLSSPNFVLKLLSEKKSAIQIVEISFTQKVKLASEVFFEEITSMTITPNVEVILNITPIVNASLQLDDVRYNVMIEFQQSIESPELEVQMMRSNFFSESDQELQNFKQSITLGSPFVLSKQTQNQVNSIVQMNTAMMYSMIGISGLAVLTGNVVLFFNMLDLLQQLSYLRFMQYEFPQHLRQFLESFSKISLKPLLDQLNIDEYIAKINGGKLPFQSKSNQQQQNLTLINNNQINYYYIMNAKSCYISLLVSFLTYLISSLIISSKFQIFLNDKLSQSTKKYSVSPISKLHQIKYQISLKCYQIKSNYLFTGLFQCYFAILHQFLYSSFLQFPDYDFTTPLNCVNSINAIGAIFLVFYVCFKSFSIPSLSNKNTKKWQYFFSENSVKYWPVYLKSLQMLKIICYIFTIVFCIDYPEVQSFLLSFQSTFYLLYLWRHKPIKLSIDLRKLMIREICFIAITGTFLVYSFDLSSEKMLLFGWIHIYGFVAIMATQLLFDLVKQLKSIYNSYLRELRIKQLKQEARYYNNPLQQFILIEHQNQQQFTIK